jgi:hypothetical protein
MSGPSRKAPPPKDQRIEYIADLMRRGKYQRRVTPRALSAEWGLAIATVEGDACDAARIVRIAPEQREAYRLELQAYVDGVRRSAMRRKNKITGLPDHNGALRAIEMAAKFAGIRLDEPEAFRAEAPRIEIVTGVDDDADDPD